MLDKKLEELLGSKLPEKKPVLAHIESENVDASGSQFQRDQLITILQNISSDGARLRRPDINSILEGFGFDAKLTDEEDETFEEIWNSLRKKRSKLKPVIEAKEAADIAQLESDIKFLKNKINNSGLKDDPEVVQLKETVEKIAKQSRSFAAPIKIPSPKNMEVQLVSADSLHRLSEYNSDINILLTLASVFLGAFLGMIGNFIFSTSKTAEAIGLIVILAVVSVLFFILYYRADQRKKNITNDINETEESVYIDEYEA